MDRFLKLFLFICSVGLIASAQTIKAEDIRYPLKSVTVSIDHSSAEVRGHWTTTGVPDLTIPRINFSQIRCEAARRKCTELVAKLISPAERGDRGSPLLILETREYSVTHWDRRRLIAVWRPRAADFTLTISFMDGSAGLVIHETEARGATGASEAAKRFRLD